MFYRIVGVLTGVLKNFANLTGKDLRQVKCERRSLTLSIQSATCTQLFPVSSAESLRIPFF